ncbi:decaprenyl-phosphate phosphoribosyltransferase [Anaerolineales bacterium]|nr:decaprenyl-phosphate phosphoribosyltransferase [Geobacter sp.]CAG0956458.1 decaprenyl-phosphate phosphoribosyltransferase [Anaerolineales bacterium]
MVGFLALLRLCRPTQWLKNLMLFFPPFLSGSILHPEVAVKGMPAFIAFCLASSSGYILNDIVDLDHDRLHPRKKYRPLPAGVLKPVAAAILALLLFCGGTGVAVISLSSRFLLFLLLYLLVTAIYSLKVKDIPLLDVFCVATGFIVRLLAGGEAFAVLVSDWLFLTVFLLALFLSIGKRLTEKRNLGIEAELHRKSLAGYPDGFLDGAMYLTGGSVLVTYSMYTISRGQLLYTVPLCCFGLLRYVLRVKSGLSGDPTESLIKDAQLLIIALVWAAAIAWEIYSGYRI